MKNALALLALVYYFIPHLAGQPSKFVEVLVTDTIHLEAQHLLFEVMQYNEESIHRAARMDSTIRQFNLISHKQLKQLAEANHGVIIKKDDNAWAIIPNFARDENETSTLVIDFKSVSDLDRFRESIKDYDNIMAFLLASRAETDDAQEERLLEKTIKKGRAKAVLYAEKMGNLVGEMIGISDMTEDQDGENARKNGWKAYPPMSVPFETAGVNTEVVKQKTLKLKFLLIQ